MHSNPTRMSRFRHGVGALVVLALAFPAFAQDDSNDGIDEIIVTATKREQSIQDIPIAVSAFGAEDLENRGIAELGDLNQISPSISVYNSNSSANGGTMRIRGVGTTGNNPGLESAVGFFIDGVYRSRSGQGFSDFLDVERIEVLRGPQGTLFGKNTVAGAVSIITKKPNFEEFGGNISATYGNFDQKRLTASVTGPLIEDVLAFRVAGSWRDRDGYVQDFNSTDAYVNRDRYSIKAQLMWNPTENLSVRFIADYGEHDETCCPASFFANGPTSGLVGMLGGTIVGATAGRNTNNDPREVGLNFKPDEQVKDWGVMLDVTYDWNEVTIRSITAYREFEAFREQDIDFSSADILAPQNADDTFENFSQELQFIGSMGDLDWLIGLYAYSEDITTDEEILFSTMGGTFVDFLFQAAGAPAGSISSIIHDRAGYSANWTSEAEGYAIFSNNTYHATEQLDVTVGFRYSRERKEATARINGALPSTINPINGAVGVINGAFCDNLSASGGFGSIVRGTLRSLCDNVSWDNSETERELTGTVSLSYAVTEDMNVYGSVSRGYKAGGFNLDQESFDSTVDTSFGGTGAELSRADDTRFEPEFVTAYELGWKSSWMDGSMTVNMAFFISKFENFQLNSFNGLGFVISNLNAVESRGVEFEMLWAMSESLLVNIGATYADARYGDNLGTAGAVTHAQISGAPAVASSLDGHRLTYAPSWNGSASVNYETLLPGTDWTIRTVWSVAYRGRANTGSNLHPIKLVSDAWFQNVRFAATSPDGAWQVALWSTNLTNEYVPMVVFDSVFQGGSFSTFANDPRMFGVTVTFNFGAER